MQAEIGSKALTENKRSAEVVFLYVLTWRCHLKKCQWLLFLSCSISFILLDLIVLISWLPDSHCSPFTRVQKINLRDLKVSNNTFANPSQRMSEIPSLMLKETRKFANRLPNSNFLMQNMMKFISSVLQHLGLLPVCLPLKITHEWDAFNSRLFFLGHLGQSYDFPWTHHRISNRINQPGKSMTINMIVSHSPNETNLSR